MSDEERDVDIESDGDKRAHHNALERKRRDHIKDSFSGLRDSVPTLQGEKSSRAQILKKAADYIHLMRRKTSAHQHDIDDLKNENGILESQIRALEKACNIDDHFGANTITENSSTVITNTKGTSVSAFDGGSGTESSDSEKQTHSSNSSLNNKKIQHQNQGGGRKKKLKTDFMNGL